MEFNAEISNNANKKPWSGLFSSIRGHPDDPTETSNLCGLLCVSWAYAHSGAGDTANIGVSQERQGILVFLWNAVCNLQWKVWGEQTIWACLCSHDPWLREFSETRNIREFLINEMRAISHGKLKFKPLSSMLSFQNIIQKRNTENTEI